jgi:hypothetical protein
MSGVDSYAHMSDGELQRRLDETRATLASAPSATRS